MLCCLSSVEEERWSRISASLGGSIWVTAVLLRLIGRLALSDLDLLLLFALGVITPLALSLSLPPVTHRISRALVAVTLLLQPIAALVGSVSLVLHPGPLAAMLSAPWALFTALAALTGVLRLAQKSSVPLANLCCASALIYLPIGGIWFALAQLGARPLGLSPIIVLLTAVHFHFITLAALVMTGLSGYAMHAVHQEPGYGIWTVAAVSMLITPSLVAAGITLTQVAGTRWLESTAAFVFAATVMVIALMSLRFVVPATSEPVARGLLVVSSATVLVTMLLAIAYALGAATGIVTITISQMIAVHGWLNALGFGFCGLFGWRLKTRQAR